MKTFLIILVSLLLISCDKEVSRTVSEPQIIQKEISCHHYGYCHKCSLNMNGDFKCEYKFSHYCSGNQLAEVKITPISIKYESGNIKHITQQEVLKELSVCK